MEPADPHRSDDYDISTRLARSTGVLTVPASVDEVVRAIADLSKIVTWLRPVHLSTAGAEFKRDLNFWTWGLRITLSFRPLGPDRTHISAKAVPKLPTTLFDWGQGARDLRTLLGAIGHHIPSTDRGGGQTP